MKREIVLVSLNPVSAFRMTTATSGIAWFAVCSYTAIVTLMDSPHPERTTEWLGAVVIGLIMTCVLAVLSGIGVGLACAIYNAIARRYGGYKLTIEDTPLG